MLFGFPKDKTYLENACIIAQKINASPKEVKAFWFFNTRNLPNKKLLSLLVSSRHEIGLHVINDLCKEQKCLQKVVHRKINYYSIHGTDKLITQLLWKRKFGQKQTEVQSDISLKSFHTFPTYSLDVACSSFGDNVAAHKATEISNEQVISMHPEWLFTGNKTHGSFYTALIELLGIPPLIEYNSNR
jgi:hypothetical protein